MQPSEALELWRGAAKETYALANLKLTNGRNSEAETLRVVGQAFDHLVDRARKSAKIVAKGK